MSYQATAIAQHGDALPQPLRAGVDPFIAQTYGWLFAALAAMVAVATASFYLVPRSWLGGLSTADGVLWFLCGWLGWRKPLSVVFPLFCLVTGLVLGALAHRYPDTAISAAVLSLVGFGGLSAYVHLRGGDFSFLHGFLALAFYLLAAGSVQLMFEPQRFPKTQIFLSALGVAAFGAWILYDTSEIIERADDDQTPGRAAFELFIDLVGLDGWLSDLLDLWKRSDDEP